jgi:hypothetical protein
LRSAQTGDVETVANPFNTDANCLILQNGKEQCPWIGCTCKPNQSLGAAMQKTYIFRVQTPHPGARSCIIFFLRITLPGLTLFSVAPVFMIG